MNTLAPAGSVYPPERSRENLLSIKFNSFHNTLNTGIWPAQGRGD